MNFLERCLLKHKTRKLFRDCLNKRQIDEIFNNSDRELKKEIVECGYIILDIIQNEKFDETLTAVSNYFLENGNFFVEFYGTLIEILLFNKPNFEKKIEINIDKINNVVKNIPESIKSNLRGIFGITNARLGFYGGKTAFTYMVLLDNYYEKIIKIDKLILGEMKLLEEKN